MKDIYRGSLIRLSSAQPDVMAKAFSQWDRDSELHRLADTDPSQLWSEKKYKNFFEKELEKDSARAYRFVIHTLAEDKLIGVTGLVTDFVNGDAWLYIVITDRAYWSSGYGTDTMKTIVQYGFLELNLRRISLGLHAYNERALKTYQKVGFQLEGRTRGDGMRDGVRYDGLWMGLLREEWLAQQVTK